MQSREELRNRRRRIIWNNDGDDLCITANHNDPGGDWHKQDLAPFYAHFPKRFETPDDLLRVRMKGRIEGTQVDAIFYQGYTARPNWEFPSENTKALGPDPLRHVVDYAHSNGMEFFYSIRMNDIHHAVHQGTFMWSKFMIENLRLLQGQVDREWFDEKVLPWMRGETEKHPLADASVANCVRNLTLKRSGVSSKGFAPSPTSARRTRDSQTRSPAKRRPWPGREQSGG